MSGYKRKSIVTGALILTLASVITRILGFVYRIYMSQAVGAEGMGLYQLIMPIYSLAWSISCSGITTTVSKLTAQENARKEYGNIGRVLKQSLFITCSIGLILCFLMFFGADFIGSGFLKDSRTVASIRILAFAVPFMAAGSCVRGYFLGLQESVTPAVSQVLEQVIRMGTVYVLASSFMARGLSYACVAAVIGIFLGETISCAFMLIHYMKFKKKHSFTRRPSMEPMASLSLIVSMALPLTLNRVSGSLLATFENALIPQRLQVYGMTQEQAMSAYGRISGMAMPLIFFPSALLVALSVTLVPAVSEAMATGNVKRVSETISKSLLFTSILALGAAVIFIVLPHELGMVIYKQDISQTLLLLGVMCPLWYMNITLGGILNGLGQQMLIFRNSLMSSAITIGFVYFLVPVYGENAFILGWFVSLLIVNCLGLIQIHKTAGIEIPLVRWFAKPGLAAAATGLVVKYVSKNYFFPLLGGVVGIIVTIGAIGLMYFAIIMLLGCVDLNDIRSMFKKRKPALS